MRKISLPIVLLALTLGAPALADAAAPQDPTHAVKELVKQGTAEYAKQNWEAARVAFAKAWDLKQHYAIAANLGDVELKLKLYRAAAEHFKYAIANLPAEHLEKRADAEASLKECRAHLSAVRVSVSVAGATVRLDGHDLPTEVVADELLLEPGPHKLEAEKAGYLVSSREFTSTAGEAREVRLELAPQPPPSDVSPTQPAPTTNPVASSTDTGRHESSRPVWILVGGGAATVLAAGLGTYYTLHGSSLASDGTRLRAQIDQQAPAAQNTNSTCAPGSSMRPAACDALAQNNKDRDTASTDAAVSWVAAGVLGAATITTYLLWPKSETAHEQHARVSVAPWLVGARGGAVRIDF